MKKCNYGSVNSIETLGTLDGPGIRVVVFLNGCKLRCAFCHNPEMWKLKEKNISANELVTKILKYKPYFKTNGGVTFSGGEPLLQKDFLKEVIMALKQENIHVAIDTAGVGNVDIEFLNLVDLVIFDIKALDRENYFYITNYEIDSSLEFINKVQKCNKEIWIRQVIIPGINDNYQYIDKLKDFIKKIKNVTKIELLPYHTLAIDKYKKLGISYKLDGVLDMDKEKCNILQEYLLK